jgi:uncharacterized protein YecE (DUF72 family)
MLKKPTGTMSPTTKTKLSELAEAGVSIGTSSWKYPGWCGQLYDEQRYLTRKKFSKAKFEATCLEEYAQTFHTVCVDAGYYQFPTEQWLTKLCTPVPANFRFSFKVTDTITVKHFANLPRHGSFAGKRNDHFLSAEMFRSSFLRPCAPFRQHIGVLFLEFSQFHQRDFERGGDFVAALDGFLSELPRDWQYAVEIRNRNFLHPEYFAMLREHGVAHVFNSWSRMPPVGEQMALPDSVTTDFCAARFLLTPGRTYENAVAEFSPYAETKAEDPAARAAGRELIAKAKVGKRGSFIYVNNRLEGNALRTIEAMLES